MVLVRSVTEEDLNPNDLKARIIRHFHEPMPEMADANAALIDLCQSGFERDLFSVLIESGYRVIPQVGSEGFSIDMVVEGESGRRLAIECDGDLYHGPERWADDMRRPLSARPRHHAQDEEAAAAFKKRMARPEAVTRPTMRFVEIKTQAQLDMQTLHRSRDRLVGERTALITQLRAILLEPHQPGR
jgi:hypothetical protein